MHAQEFHDKESLTVPKASCLVLVQQNLDRRMPTLIANWRHIPGVMYIADKRAQSCSLQSGEAPAAKQEGHATTAPGGQVTTSAADEKPPKPQKRSGVTIPSAFKYLTSTSFKREALPPPPGVPSIPDTPEEVRCDFLNSPYERNLKYCIERCVYG